MNKLSTYDYSLYPTAKVFIHPGKIVGRLSFEFYLALSTEFAPKPILKPLGAMSIDDASKFIEFGLERHSYIYIVDIEDHTITAVVQPHNDKKVSRRTKKFFNFNGTYTAAQFRYLLEKEYDVFGWIESGLAITQSQAEDNVWRDVVKEVEKLPEEMGLYSVPVIAEAQIGMTFKPSIGDFVQKAKAIMDKPNPYPNPFTFIAKFDKDGKDAPGYPKYEYHGYSLHMPGAAIKLDEYVFNPNMRAFMQSGKALIDKLGEEPDIFPTELFIEGVKIYAETFPNPDTDYLTTE